MKKMFSIQLIVLAWFWIGNWDCWSNPPVFEEIGVVEACETVAFEIVPVASDPDGDDLTYSTGELPEGAMFDPAGPLFSWTPGIDQSGEYEVMFSVSDGDLTDEVIATIQVGNVDYLAYAGGDEVLLGYNSCEGSWNALTAPPVGEIGSLQFTEPGHGFATIDWAIWEYANDTWTLFFDDQYVYWNVDFLGADQMAFRVYHGAHLWDTGFGYDAYFVAPYSVDFTNIFPRPDGSYSGYGMFTEGNHPAAIFGFCENTGPSTGQCYDSVIDIPPPCWSTLLGPVEYDHDYGDVYSVTCIPGESTDPEILYLFGPWGMDAGIDDVALHDVSLGSTDIAFLLTDDGELWRRYDGGMDMFALGTADAAKVDAYNEDEAWIVGAEGDQGLALHYLAGAVETAALPALTEPWGLSEIFVLRMPD